MDFNYRPIRLDNEEELRTICAIDIAIPASFEPDFVVNEKAINDRVADLQKRFTAEDFLEVAIDRHDRVVGFCR